MKPVARIRSRLLTLSSTCAMALLCSGCACNLNWQWYRSVPGSTVASSEFIREEFIVQINGTDHSWSSGFTSDIRAPYSIHTGLRTRTKVSAFEITRIELVTPSGAREILNAKDHSIRVSCAENQNGLFIGFHTEKDAFDEMEPIITIRIEGWIIFPDRSEFFSFERRYKMEKGKQRWLSFSDLMSV